MKEQHGTHLVFQDIRRELEDRNRLLQLEVAERLKIEEEVRRLNCELEQRVEERTHELKAVNIHLQEEIEERRRAEEELRNREAFLSVIIENIPDMIFIKEAEELRFVRFNKAGEDLLGYSRDEMLGKNDYDFFPKNEADFFTGKDREVLRKGALVDIPEEPIHTRTSGTRILHTKKIPIVDKCGKAMHLLGISEDITERKRSEEALKESEERYRIAIENSNDGIAMVKGDRHIFVNQRFLTIFGYDRPEEILDQPIFKIIHPDDRDNLIEINRKRQRGEPLPSRYEFKGIRKDGGEVFIEVSVAKSIYRGENVILAILRDVSERKRLEALLQQAQKMEAIGTLAGGIAHDFNNILAVILGGVELSLLETTKDSPGHGYLVEVLKATERATDLVQQILTFSRKKELERKPLQVSILCKEALKMLRATLPSTIEIHQQIDPQTGRALVDPTQIHQIVMNLCSNAAHAMREKGGRLCFTLKNRDFSPEKTIPELNLKAGPYIELKVSDTGQGMEPAILERIFDPYFTTKEIGEGTGLGLAVVHGIVKSYQGAIEVRSEPGKGTTFQLYIPRIEGLRETPKRQKDLEPARGKERILFIDDEESIIRIGKRMLEYLGYKVKAFTSSPEALALFKKDPLQFDLVITDHIMPKMTGTELARRIRWIRPDMPIMMISGMGDMMTPQQKEARGLKAFIKKPLVIESLAEKIRQVLDH